MRDGKIASFATITASVSGCLLIFAWIVSTGQPTEWTWTTGSQTTYFLVSRYGKLRAVRQTVTPARSGNLTAITDKLDVHGVSNGSTTVGPKFSSHPPAPIGFQLYHYLSGWESPGSSGRPNSSSVFTFDYWSIGCPYWFPIILLFVFVALKTRSRVIRSRRRLAGHCLTCGYDLRASPDRCPECGTPIRNTSAEPS